MAKPISRLTRLSFAIGVVALSCLAGCQRTEKVLDVEAPGVDVEIERDKDTGKVEVDVNG